MYTYYIEIFFIILFGLILNKTKQERQLYYIFYNIILITISSLRGYEVGGDLTNYIPLFHEIAKSSWNELFTNYDKYGLVFKFIIKCCSLVSDESTWYLFVLSLINLSIPLYFIQRYSKIPWLGVFLYVTLSYYTNTFNSVRSSMALSFSILGMMYLLKNKNYKALLWFIIAFEVHKTIIPIFLLFYLKNVKPTFCKLAIPIFSSIIIANMFGLAGFMDILVLYNEMNNYGGIGNLEMGGKGYGMLAFDILLTFGCYFLTCKNMTHTERVLIMTLCLATCCQAVAPLYSLVTRIAYFFTFYSVVLIPDIIFRSFKCINRKLVIISLSIFALYYFKIFIMTPSNDFVIKSNSQLTIPYYFFWEQRPKL